MTDNFENVRGSIFVVEDTPDNLLLITTILSDNGYTIHAAKNGHEAIKAITEKQPDLVILDIKMPDIDGFEVCTRLKSNKKTSSIPVIFITALTQIADKQRGFAVGGVDYIVKPFNVEEVLKRVQIHLENGRLRVQLELQANELNFKNDLLQKEISDHKLVTERLVESFNKLEDSKIAALNILDDLKAEIEQRKRSEDIALVSEQRFRGFIENASDIVFSLSMEETFTYISPNEPGAHGNFADEGIGRKFDQYIHPDDIHLCRGFLKKIKDSGERITSDDYRVIQGDGSYRWHSSKGSALRDIDGKLTGYLGIARDITDRKLAEKAIKQSEEKFRNAFLTSPDSININRLEDGMYIQINNGFTQIMGYKEEETIGKTSLELNIWNNPNEREKLVKGLKTKGFVENLEALFCTKNGEVKYGLMSAAIMDLNGEPHILSITRDITERNQADEKIRKLGRHYQALIENAPDGIALIDAHGKFRFVSPSAKKIFGYELSDSINVNSQDFIHPEDLSMVLPEFDKLLKKPSYVPTLQYRFAEKSGNWKWIESTFTNLLADPGVEAIIINFRDIHDRKITEEALTESERLLRESQIIAGLGSYVWNISTGFWTSSKVLDEVFGIDGNYARSLEGWSNIVHPDWRNSMGEYVANEVIGKKKRFDKEYKIIRQDSGQERWVHGLGELEVSSISKSVILIGTIKDITERKQIEIALKESELRFRLLFDKAPLGYQSLDINGNFIDVNQAWLDTLGYNRSEVIGNWFGDFLTPMYQEGFRKRFPVFKSKGKIHSEFEMLRKDGNIRFIAIDGRVGKSLDGKFKQTHCILKDITEQKHAEEEILKLNAELEQRVVQRTAQLEATNKELEAFSYSVSHDLRAPLRHINGFINLFLESKSTKLTEEELGYLNTVTKSADEMGKLIDALLTFSRLQRTELQKSKINTQELIELSIRFFHQELKSGKIEFEIGKLHETFGDIQLVRQIWINLLSNAIKYTGKKENPKIEIGSISGKNETIFYIKDNGAGFDMKYASKLFGVFQRLHKPRDFEGIGIGLANVKRIVTRHGGRCWAEGEIGKGAGFYFTLAGESTY